MVAYNFKKRFVDPIRSGLCNYEHIDGQIPAPKRQTIRAVGKRRHAMVGETVQLYYGLRTRHCFKIGEGICSEVLRVIIWIDPQTIAIELSKMLLSRAEMEAFSRADGFADVADMAAFWRTEHPDVSKFEGVVIKWDPSNG